MHILLTNLEQFRYNRVPYHNRLSITWYVIEINENSHWNKRCFTHQELEDFLEFINSHLSNFPDEKNYHSCDEYENIPFNESFFDILDEPITNPQYVTLTRDPVINENNEMRRIMDITLINRLNEECHNYNLSFAVIGYIDRIIEN